MSSGVHEAVKGDLLSGVAVEILSKKAGGEWNVTFVPDTSGPPLPGRIVLHDPIDRLLVEDKYSAAAESPKRERLLFVVDGEVVWTVEGEPGRFPIVHAVNLRVDLRSKESRRNPSASSEAPKVAPFASRKRTPDVVRISAPGRREEPSDDDGAYDLDDSAGVEEDSNPVQVLLPNFEGWRRAFGV